MIALPYPKSNRIPTNYKKRSHFHISKSDRPSTPQKAIAPSKPSFSKSDRTCTSPNTIALPQTPKKRSPLPHPKKAITLPYLQKRSRSTSLKSDRPLTSPTAIAPANIPKKAIAIYTYQKTIAFPTSQKAIASFQNSHHQSDLVVK